MTDFIQHLFDYQFLNRALITSIVVGIVWNCRKFDYPPWIVVDGRCDESCCFTWCGVVILIQYSNVRCISHWHDASLLIGYISNNSKTKPDAALVLVSLRFSQRVSSLLVYKYDRFTSYFIRKFTRLPTNILDNHHYWRRCDTTHCHTLSSINDFNF